MGLFEVLVEGVRERAQRKDVTRWQKARDIHEFQSYLKTEGRPHSTRDLAALVGVSQSTVAAQLTIAGALEEPLLERFGVSPDEIGHLSQGELLRVAKLPSYLRATPLRQAARGGTQAPGVLTSAPGTGVPKIREERRAAAYHRMREEGSFQLAIPQPVGELSRTQAYDYLDDILPAVANMAELVMGTSKSYYIGVTGNGGILVYLSPQNK